MTYTEKKPMESGGADLAPCEVARLLRISTRTVLDAIRRGDLPAIRYSRKTLMVTTTDALAWRDRCRCMHPQHSSQSTA